MLYLIFSSTGFEEIVKHLIEKHADVNITDKNGHSPLYIALQKGKLIESFNKDIDSDK